MPYIVWLFLVVGLVFVLLVEGEESRVGRCGKDSHIPTRTDEWCSFQLFAIESLGKHRHMKAYWDVSDVQKNISKWLVNEWIYSISPQDNYPTWELTYPLPMALLSRWFSFSLSVGYVVSSLKGTPLILISGLITQCCNYPQLNSAVSLFLMIFRGWLFWG